MKATGIVRRIDDLGRVVIPKEIRRTLRIRESDPLEIFTDREGEIILKKYSPIGELSAFAKQYADSLTQAAGCLVCISDMDQIIAASGVGKKDFQDKFISEQLGYAIAERLEVIALAGDRKFIPVIPEQDETICGEIITPIICEGDVIGSVVLMTKDPRRKLGETEQKLAYCAAGFLGRQMEQ